MLLRAAGGILVITATSAGGILAAERIRNQYEQLKYLQKLICLLRSEILYARSYLGEAFGRIGSKAKSPYREWMYELCSRMEERTGTAFSGIWENSTGKCLKDAGLPGNELARLADLGNQLGIADADMQVKLLDLYLDELSKSMDELREGMKMKIRLCRCLGVMSGIFVMILLY